MTAATGYIESHLHEKLKIAYATEADVPEWMELVHLVTDGFPHLDEGQYLGQLQEYIRNRQALILKDTDTAVGIMAFNEMTGSIDFLGVHPQYRKKGIAKALDTDNGGYPVFCSREWQPAYILEIKSP